VTTHRPRTHDYIIVGAGISGPFIAHELCRAGADCLMIEAGRQYRRQTYPRNDLDGTAQLYWSGGLELGTKTPGWCFCGPRWWAAARWSTRPWWTASTRMPLTAGAGIPVSIFSTKPWHRGTKKPNRKSPSRPSPANTATATQTFSSRASSVGIPLAPLRRAQKDCRYEEGNCCIECLNGCRIGSKQSTPETVLKKALALGLELRADTEAVKIDTDGR
jgi:choline dehydrogenase-like flavoprotein